ncbi:MAG: penicillin-binding protein, partial [Pseudomonadota bacterium]|nr:penicillin-binding protein [Pseudomonadota bacterium]
MLYGQPRAEAAAEPSPPFVPTPIAADPQQPRRRTQKRWRIAAVVLALFLALVAWLAVTAPLSRSLQPIAAPGITLLSADGQPIARQGSITD